MTRAPVPWTTTGGHREQQHRRPPSRTTPRPSHARRPHRADTPRLRPDTPLPHPPHRPAREGVARTRSHRFRVSARGGRHRLDPRPPGGIQSGSLAQFADVSNGTATLDPETLPEAAKPDRFSPPAPCRSRPSSMGRPRPVGVQIQGIIAAVKNRGRGWAIAASSSPSSAEAWVLVVFGIGRRHRSRSLRTVTRGPVSPSLKTRSWPGLFRVRRRGPRAATPHHSPESCASCPQIEMTARAGTRDLLTSRECDRPTDSLTGHACPRRRPTVTAAPHDPSSGWQSTDREL